MQARDIMTRPVITFRPDTTVRHAAAVLIDKRIAAAPVVDEDDELLGMVSEIDLIGDRFRYEGQHADSWGPGGDQRAQTVGAVMVAPAIGLPASADAAELAETMLRHDVRSLPILEGAEVVGIVSRRDLLRTLVRNDETIRAEVATGVAAYLGAGNYVAVEVSDGQVDLYDDPGDDRRTRVLLAMARAVPGVSVAQIHHRQPARRT
jgi:CBS domain-containing protein